MLTKKNEKEKAIILRKQGKTYKEILSEVQVSKSTISTWLHNVGLAKPQAQKLTAKKIAAQKRGAARRHEMRLESTIKIHTESLREIGQMSTRDLFILGVGLYWAEGSKEKESRPGSRVQFANSDPEMIKFFLYWLTKICKVQVESIQLCLYIHENHRANVEQVKTFWLQQTGFYPERVYFKRHNPKTKRKNTSQKYHGLIAVNVRASSVLNRQIAGWVHGIVKNYWGVV